MGEKENVNEEDFEPHESAVSTKRKLRELSKCNRTVSQVMHHTQFCSSAKTQMTVHGSHSSTRAIANGNVKELISLSTALSHDD